MHFWKSRAHKRKQFSSQGLAHHCHLFVNPCAVGLWASVIATELSNLNRDSTEKWKDLRKLQSSREQWLTWKHPENKSRAIRCRSICVSLQNACIEAKNGWNLQSGSGYTCVVRFAWLWVCSKQSLLCFVKTTNPLSTLNCHNCESEVRWMGQKHGLTLTHYSLESNTKQKQIASTSAMAE